MTERTRIRFAERAREFQAKEARERESVNHLGNSPHRLAQALKCDNLFLNLKLSRANKRNLCTCSHMMNSCAAIHENFNSF